ncbi:MAG: ABC transporter permease [Verrucomicrobia bacterium]|nr:ABC transporter permease [Verrucomicrobiota bacterium]NBR63620.1 ABC transporter permease [Verrucomicrobiota bacterium]
MLTFLARRFISSIPVVIAVLALCFLLVRIAPGSPFAAERALDARTKAVLETKYGLSGSLPEQLLRYGSRVLRGDLGDSLKFRGRTVAEIIGQSLPRSLLIGSISFTLALALGIPLGAYAAAQHRGKGDSFFNSLALLTLSTPTFVLAPVSVLVFAFGLKLLPPAGWGTPSQLILPAFCLAIPFIGAAARLTRAGLLDTLNSDFVRAARAKGVSEASLVYRHALRPAILPLVAYAGPLAANILTGSLVIEEVFAIPGIGQFFVNGVINRDVFLVSGVVLVYCFLLLLFNLMADWLTALLDPRIRLSS